MRKLLVSAIIVLAAAGPSSATETFVAELSSAKTGTGSPAVGTGILVLSDDATSVQYDVSYSGLLGELTGCHVHRKAGGIIFDLGTLNPSVGTWDTILPEDVTRLRTGGLFINVHSDLYPTGEIQGALFPQENPVKGATWGAIKALYSH